MLDTIWFIPIMIIIISGIYGAVKAFKHPRYSHDRAEILSGLGIILLVAGVVKLCIEIGDIISLILVLVGMFISVIYGIEHIFARRKERRL